MKSEQLDASGLPRKLTKHLNVKANKYHAPKIKTVSINSIRCEFCKETMYWDKEVGMYFCTGCVYSKSHIGGK
jgi:formylmethanofuran dehydrogenase subunit E